MVPKSAGQSASQRLTSPNVCSRQIATPKRLHMHTLTPRGCSLTGRTYKLSASRWNNTRHVNFFHVAVFARRHHVGAVVVGAGPAGIATVGALLENLPQDAGNIVWIDPKFDAGKIAKYHEVPSNTKAGLFLDYAEAVEPFREICQSSPKPNAITAIENLPRQDTCSLRYAGDMLRFLTLGLKKHERVEQHVGHLKTSKWDENSSRWRLLYRQAVGRKEVELTAPMVVYCTGSSPKTMEIPQKTPTSLTKAMELIPLETALTPSLLKDALELTKAVRVGVIGSSHSAVLILMNLVRLAQSTHPGLRVLWFSRSPHFKYAEQKDGWILYDNTGLKGLAAQFARAELDSSNLGTSKAGKVIQRIDCSGGVEAETDAISTWAPHCDYVVQAIGFKQEPLPVEEKARSVFNHETGAFEDGAGRPVPGAFGAGIAFPEQVTDPAGNTEFAVGFWKFMSFLRRVVPRWVESVHLTEKSRKQVGEASA